MPEPYDLSADPEPVDEFQREAERIARAVKERIEAHKRSRAIADDGIGALREAEVDRRTARHTLDQQPAGSDQVAQTERSLDHADHAERLADRLSAQLDAELINTELINTELPNTKLIDARLTDTRLIDARLIDARLRDTKALAERSHARPATAAVNGVPRSGVMAGSQPAMIRMTGRRGRGLPVGPRKAADRHVG